MLHFVHLFSYLASAWMLALTSLDARLAAVGLRGPCAYGYCQNILSSHAQSPSTVHTSLPLKHYTLATIVKALPVLPTPIEFSLGISRRTIIPNFQELTTSLPAIKIHTSCASRATPAVHVNIPDLTPVVRPTTERLNPPIVPITSFHCVGMTPKLPIIKVYTGPKKASLDGAMRSYVILLVNTIRSRAIWPTGLGTFLCFLLVYGCYSQASHRLHFSLLVRHARPKTPSRLDVVISGSNVQIEELKVATIDSGKVIIVPMTVDRKRLETLPQPSRERENMLLGHVEHFQASAEKLQAKFSELEASKNTAESKIIAQDKKSREVLKTLQERIEKLTVESENAKTAARHQLILRHLIEKQTRTSDGQIAKLKKILGQVQRDLFLSSKKVLSNMLEATQERYELTEAALHLEKSAHEKSKQTHLNIDAAADRREKTLTSRLRVVEGQLDVSEQDREDHDAREKRTRDELRRQKLDQRREAEDSIVILEAFRSASNKRLAKVEERCTEQLDESNARALELESSLRQAQGALSLLEGRIDHANENFLQQQLNALRANVVVTLEELSLDTPLNKQRVIQILKGEGDRNHQGYPDDKKGDGPDDDEEGDEPGEKRGDCDDGGEGGEPGDGQGDRSGNDGKVEDASGDGISLPTSPVASAPPNGVYPAPNSSESGPNTDFGGEIINTTQDFEPEPSTAHGSAGSGYPDAQNILNIASIADESTQFPIMDFGHLAEFQGLDFDFINTDFPGFDEDGIPTDFKFSGTGAPTDDPTEPANGSTSPAVNPDGVPMDCDFSGPEAPIALADDGFDAMDSITYFNAAGSEGPLGDGLDSLYGDDDVDMTEDALAAHGQSDDRDMTDAGPERVDGGASGVTGGDCHAEHLDGRGEVEMADCDLDDIDHDLLGDNDPAADQIIQDSGDARPESRAQNQAQVLARHFERLRARFARIEADADTDSGDSDDDDSDNSDESDNNSSDSRGLGSEKSQGSDDYN